jgi:predicted permease
MIHDLLYAIRALRARPGFTLTVVLTLALAMGATTAVFSVADGVLLKPLPVADQDRLLVVWKAVPARGFEHMPFTFASFEEVRDRLLTAGGVAAHPYHGASRAVLERDATTEPLHVTGVTGEWFDVLRVRARAGRLIEPTDDRMGAAPVLVLSSASAARLFGSDAAALGQIVHVNDVAHTVIGVAPAGLEFPAGSDAWAAATPFFLNALPDARSLHDANRIAWDLVVRAGDGAGIAQVRAELDALLPTLATESASLGVQEIRSRAFDDAITGDVRPALLAIAAAVALVLVVAGVNVANLLLVRGLTRRRELAIRIVAGASLGRIVRQVVAEIMVLVMAGAMAGMMVARFALRGLLTLAPEGLPRIALVSIDGRALLFTLVLVIVTSLLFGLLPAWGTASARTLAGAALRASGADAARQGYRVRHSLVMAQIAITVLVVWAAGLLLRSLDRMQRLDFGFGAENVVLAEVVLPPGRYALEADHQRAMVRIARRVAALPAVGSASAVVTLPFSGSGGVDAVFFAEGQSQPASSNPYANYEGVDAAHFTTMGLAVRQGRGIEETDREGSPRVVVVNEAFARLYWPGEDAIGRRIKLGGPEVPSEWHTVVGVVADTRYRQLTTLRPGVYVPYEQGIPVTPRYIAVRTAASYGVAGAVRTAVADEEPGADIVAITPLPRLLAQPLARPRFQSALATAFALLGLLLCANGTYGVLSFFVRQRTREIGIRMALGAAPQRVRQWVLRQALLIGGTGILAGIAAALLAGRLIESLVFDVSTTDPLVLTAAAAVILFATLAATVLPTRFATRTDPMLVMRAD